jgi:hypothetical protein
LIPSSLPPAIDESEILHQINHTLAHISSLVRYTFLIQQNGSRSASSAGDLLPKKKSTRAMWRRIYQALRRQEQIYLANEDHPRLPTYDERAEYLLSRKLPGYSGKGLSDRTLRKIIQAGRAGLLK